MANAASTIEIELEIRDAINRLGKLEGELKKSSSAMDRVANSTRKMESAFKSAKNAASALVAAISVQQIAQAADTFTNFANQIRIATSSAAEAAAVQKELYRVAQTTGTAIKDTTELYSLLRIAADQLGSSQAETIRITEIVTKSLAAAGKSSTEASGALLQLAQALNSPIVQAEEFNSLIDGMPNLLKEVEKQLGLTAGSLIKFVKESNLSNQEFKDAILGSAEAINEQFGAAQDTIGTATQRINNSLTMLIGKFEQSTGIFNKTANALTKLATEFDKADNIVRQFSEVVVMLGVYFDKLKQLALALTKPLRDAFSVFSGGTSNPIAKTINYIQYSLSLLTVAVDYQTQNLAIRLERLAYQIRDFFIGMVANLLSFFESVDNFFINQINKVIGYYNSAADSIGMDGDVAPIATSTSARESELKFERDSAEFLADSYRRQADLLRQAEEAYAAVNAEFNQYTQQIDSGTLLKTEEQLGKVNLEAANAASSVEKLKEKIEEVKEIEYTDFTGKISQEQQDRFTEALEEEFRIRREMKQLTEAQNEAYGQQLEDQFRQVAEVEEYLGRINERGIERTEVEQINYDYANEIAKVKADQNLTIEQEIQLVNALEDAQQRELNNQEKKLTYLDKVNESLQEQLGLSEGAAAAVISGISGAGPNASRGMNIAQSKSLDEAALKLILSNEKVAKAIDSSFELLFEVLDPFIDLLGDLISAINRLIGALAKGIGDGIQSVLDQAGVGQDSYLFGGDFASDFEQFSFDISGGMFGVNNRPTGMSAEEYSSFSLGLWQRTSADAVAELLQDVGNVGFSSIMEGVETEYQKVVERIQSMSGDDVTDEQRSQLLKNAAAANESLINRLNQQFRAMSNDKTVELLKEINERGIERNRIDQIRIDYTKEINQASEDLSLTEEDQTKVINALIKARDREIESIERQQQLLQLQSVQSDLQSLFSDFENTIEAISELVQSLFDQVNDLLFSEFNLAGPQEAFALAQGTYESLLANAFDPDATEEDIEALQGFVNDYLSAARDVFKSSTAFTTIFEGVLSDLALLGTQYGFNAPIAAASTLSSGAEDLLGDLPEELQTAVSDLISGINLATLAFAQQQVEFLTTVYQIPIELKAGNFIVDTSGVNKEISLNSSNFSLDSSRLNLSLLMSSSMFTVNTSGLNFGTITPTATAGRPNLGTVYPIVSLGTPNLGKITPAVSPGIPNLGVITPTLTLDTSKITSSLDSLSTIINDAFSLMIGAVQLQATILEAQASGITTAGGPYAGVPTTIMMGPKQYLEGQAAIGGYGVDFNTDIDYGEGFSLGVRGVSGLTPDQQFASIYNKLPETAPYLLNQPYYVLLSAGPNEAAPKLAAFDEIEEARSFYNYMSTTSGFYGWDEPVFKYGFRRGGIVDPMDTIPAMLSPGEYILSPETVRRYGVSNLNRLNSGDSAALNATSDPEVKRLLAELIVAVRENDTEVNVYTDMQGQTKAGIEEFRSELRERTRRQGDKFLPARYI
jgi:tape measure domain-containing protein